jgi:hypothetical protein
LAAAAAAVAALLMRIHPAAGGLSTDSDEDDPLFADGDDAASPWAPAVAGALLTGDSVESDEDAPAPPPGNLQLPPEGCAMTQPAPPLLWCTAAVPQALVRTLQGVARSELSWAFRNTPSPAKQQASMAWRRLPPAERWGAATVVWHEGMRGVIEPPKPSRGFRGSTAADLAPWQWLSVVVGGTLAAVSNLSHCYPCVRVSTRCRRRRRRHPMGILRCAGCRWE